ncbi:MAG: DUF4317 domain-containing protein [Lachnospiraceae bacterium]|nr:DUF4317 domain-containing protein [Lachnospiraceae bacterium]
MQKKDILELKKRLKKEGCTFTRMCGCYVNAKREKVVNIGETFLNLDDEEFYKYLEIAKKALSGNIGNNMLQLYFPKEEEELGGKQQFLMGLRESRLKNDALLDHLYDMIIEHYDYVGNYLILIFHDAYDVITKTNDDLKIDESEEVYEYLLCAICPVCLSKPGLGYREEENRIGVRIQDWVVGTPDVGFLFPSFEERSSDIHSLTYYVKDASDSHAEFIENALGCSAKRTATEEKQTFHSMVKAAIAPIIEESDKVMIEIQENLNTIIETKEEFACVEPEEIILTPEIVEEILTQSEIPDATVANIKERFTEEFQDAPPAAINVIDEKALEKSAKEKRQLELVQKVETLEKALNSGSDVVLRVAPEKAEEITSQYIDGKKCIIIPVTDDEQITINGIDTEF